MDSMHDLARDNRHGAEKRPLLSKHFLSVAYLNRDLVLDLVVACLSQYLQSLQGNAFLHGRVQSSPGQSPPTIVPLFMQPSTRTRGSLAAAARILGYSLDTGYVDPMASSMAKGESLIFTVRQIIQQGADVIAVR